MKIRYLLITVLFWAWPCHLVRAESQPVFIEQEVSKNSVYVGEQTLYNFTLNTQTSVFNYQPPELSLPHVWSEAVAINHRYRRTIENQAWNAYSTRRAIYPLSAGELLIPKVSIPVGIRVRVRKKVPSPFDFGDAFSDDFLEQFFADVQQKTVQLEASGIPITVKPLPPVPSDLPPGANGYIPVGVSNLSARISRAFVAVGESVTLEVHLVSTGNLNPVNEIPLTIPQGIRLYPEQAKGTQNENNAALIMRKSFRFSLVPTAPGAYTIPSIRIPYFDPDQIQYRVAETQPFVITASGSAAQAATQPQSTATAPMTSPTPAPSPSAHPQPATAPGLIGDTVSEETVTLAVSTLALLLCSAIAGMLIVRRTSPVRALKRAVRQATTPAELSEVYRSTLLTALGSQNKQYSYEELIVLIKRAALSPPLEYQCLTLLDTLEQSRFSPEFDKVSNLSDLKNKTLLAASGILSGRRTSR